jgi:hypothetical protein
MNNIYDYLEKIGRDPYIVTMPDGFLRGYFESAGALLTQYDALCMMTGVDVAGIPEMYASERQQAYKSKLSSDTAFMKKFSTLMGPQPKTKDLRKMIYPAAESDLSAMFGDLQPWDRYFIDINYDANTAFYLNRAIFIGHDIYYRRTDMYGRLFLENTAWCQTFITNAAYDLVVFSPAIPDALAIHSSILQSSFHDTEGPHGEERPGQIRLNYRQGSVPDADVTTRTIRFPFYPKSCHAVTLTEPEEILADITKWLETTGLDVSYNKGGK